jgi:CRP/FNR family transcriptional regulator, cyclic AMP receptor protein
LIVSAPASAAHTAPIDLMAAHADCEVLTLPTGARVYSLGAAADAIYGVRRGIVEVLGPSQEKLCYLNLLHNHPTLAIQLIAQQHERLREQRTSGTCCY